MGPAPTSAWTRIATQIGEITKLVFLYLIAVLISLGGPASYENISLSCFSSFLSSPRLKYFSLFLILSPKTSPFLTLNTIDNELLHWFIKTLYPHLGSPNLLHKTRTSRHYFRIDYFRHVVPASYQVTTHELATSRGLGRMIRGEE